MLVYFALLMQDAIELSANTARIAHVAVLQEMERGSISWADPDLVEKVKIRNTQRIFHGQKLPPTRWSKLNVVFISTRDIANMIVNM